MTHAKMNAPCHSSGKCRVRVHALGASGVFGKGRAQSSCGEQFTLGNAGDEVSQAGIDGGGLIEEGAHDHEIGGGESLIHKGVVGVDELTNGSILDEGDTKKRCVSCLMVGSYCGAH